jgi:glyoxylase-like metal-dependent hydrolase (beta-lactamase superfamily II)
VPPVLVTGFLAGPTNCYVAAPGPGEQCVIIDPGMGAAGPLEELLAEHRLHPVAVILTHGHFDHTFSVLPVCQARDVPAYIHPADRHQLADPWSGIGVPKGTPLFGEVTFAEPSDVLELVDGQRLELAGLQLAVRLAPGHTPGSVVFGLATALGSPPLPGVDAPLMFSGDLLFEGSIGRVDLPGGDEGAMFDSLARVVLPMDDATVVLPGHGNTTTIGRERGTNPYLRMAARAAPRTGL